MGGGERITRKEMLSTTRSLRFMEIENNGLIGKVITVQDSNGSKIEGELEFKYNLRGKMNTGYYIRDTQIPLLQIKEVGENYLRV